MGFFDKARQLLGLDPSEDEVEPAPPTTPSATGASDPRAARLEKARGRKDRPPLADLLAEHGQSVEDALAAREAGDPKGARVILATIDRGAGLRTVLRAAAALEAGDEGDLKPLLPAVAKAAEGYKLWLQVAAALGDANAAAPLVEHATREGAPPWALAWTRAMSTEPTARREGLVELLFSDAALARTVAARDLAVEGAVADSEASQTYAAFAHGRDSIRRFGAAKVAEVIARAVGR